MKILLLGKHGQLGYELANQLPAIADVVALGREALDLTDLTAVAQAVQKHCPDVIINAAAYTAVDKAETDQINCYLINAAAPSVLASEAKKIGALLIHYSTDYVFDGTKTTPYEPTDAPNPINTYGYSKLMGELGIQYSGCYYLILRTSWVYHPDYGNNFYRTMQRFAKEREVLNIVADQHGIPNDARDLAADTVNLLKQPLEQLKAQSGIYHLTDMLDKQTTWHGFAKSIIDAMPEKQCTQVNPIPTSSYPTPAKRPQWSVMKRSIPV
ncbi:MAG: dTDP-4-dehydrorhamnose reductase [Proteobacteria bacterium]|nr:dTDP-4-dehydrorhamnose reductase [Pseudomonadota bacterium]